MNNITKEEIEIIYKNTINECKGKGVYGKDYIKLLIKTAYINGIKNNKLNKNKNG